MITKPYLPSASFFSCLPSSNPLPAACVPLSAASAEEKEERKAARAIEGRFISADMKMELWVVMIRYIIICHDEKQKRVLSVFYVHSSKLRVEMAGKTDSRIVFIHSN